MIRYIILSLYHRDRILGTKEAERNRKESKHVKNSFNLKHVHSLDEGASL